MPYKAVAQINRPTPPSLSIVMTCKYRESAERSWRAPPPSSPRLRDDDLCAENLFDSAQQWPLTSRCMYTKIPIGAIRLPVSGCPRLLFFGN